jgi:hypothetical protein
LCEIKSIRKPRRITLLFLYNAKCDIHSIKCHTANNPKLQNIAMFLKPTVIGAKGVELRCNLVDPNQGFIGTVMGVKAAFESVFSTVMASTDRGWGIGLVWI